MSESRRSVGSGPSGRSRPERAAETGDEDDAAGPSGLHEEEDDPAHRRQIRSQYRDLINSVQRKFQTQTMSLKCIAINIEFLKILLILRIFLLVTENREDMLNPANNKLFDVLEEANKLFVNGKIRSSVPTFCLLLNWIHFSSHPSDPVLM